MEIQIELNNLDPILVLGVNNDRLSQIQKAFPKLKLVSRGNVIKAVGEQKLLESLQKKIIEFETFYKNYNRLSDKDFQDVLATNNTDDSWKSEKGSEVLLYGNSGVQIKAKTVNQKKIVAACDKNDMVFAIGPAGTGKTYTAVALAVRALKNKEVKKIILTRSLLATIVRCT